MSVLRCLILVLACLQHGIHGTARSNYGEARVRPESDPVLSQLRRKLMADNYDYEQSESLEKTVRSGAESQRANRANPANGDDNSELSDFTVNRNVLNGYISGMNEMNMMPIDRGQDEEPNEEGNQMSDNQEWERGLQVGAPVSPYLAKDQTSAPLPYKVLTGHGSSARRNNQMLRFLQTEMNDTVLVAPLLPGPLPVFQLPSGRRQYREVSDEYEVELNEDISSGKEDSGTGKS